YGWMMVRSPMRGRWRLRIALASTAFLAALWICSAWLAAGVNFGRPPVATLSIFDGQLGFGATSLQQSGSGPWAPGRLEWRDRPRLRLGPTWFYQPRSSGWSMGASLPLWMPLLVLGAPTLISWRRQRRLPRANLCPRCGYDRSWIESPK